MRDKKGEMIRVTLTPKSMQQAPDQVSYTMTQRKKIKARSLATIIAKKVIILRTPSSPKSIHKTNSGLCKLCVNEWGYYRETTGSKNDTTSILYIISGMLCRKRCQDPHQFCQESQWYIANLCRKSKGPHQRN